MSGPIVADGTSRAVGTGKRQDYKNFMMGKSSSIGRVALHPSSAYLGSSSFDGTWRIWSIAIASELQVQEDIARSSLTIGLQQTRICSTGSLTRSARQCIGLRSFSTCPATLRATGTGQINRSDGYSAD